VLSDDETHKRLSLLPDHLTDEVEHGIKQAISVIDVYNEISSAETNRILILSSPPEIRLLVESSENKEKEPNIPTTKGNGAICHYCGCVSFILNKCQNCNQTLVKLVKVDVRPKPNGSNSNRKL
jgi:hypothetical protein